MRKANEDNAASPKEIKSATEANLDSATDKDKAANG